MVLYCSCCLCLYFGSSITEAELHIFGNPCRTSAESGSSDICQSRQSGSAGAELHIVGSQGRAEVQMRNFTFLAVNAERKCGRGI